MKAIEDHWKKFGNCATVRVARKSIVNRRDTVEVNWNAFGSVSPERAEAFACELMDAVNYAQSMEKEMADEKETT